MTFLLSLGYKLLSRTLDSITTTNTRVLEQNEGHITYAFLFLVLGMKIVTRGMTEHEGVVAFDYGAKGDPKSRKHKTE